MVIDEWTTPSEEEEEAYFRSIQRAAWEAMTGIENTRNAGIRLKIFLQAIVAIGNETRNLNKEWPEKKHHPYFNCLDIMCGLWMCKDGFIGGPEAIAVPRCEGGGHYAELLLFCEVARQLNELAMSVDMVNEQSMGISIYPEDLKELIPAFLKSIKISE